MNSFNVTYYLFLTFLLIINSFSYAEYEFIKEKNPFSQNREEFLQNAIQLREKQEYDSALDQLNQILNTNKDDAPVLLLKGDIELQSKKFSSAVETYKRLLPFNYEKTIVNINLSYALFMNNKASEALSNARAAWQGDSLNSNAIVNYFNAFLWNGKSYEAEVFLNEQEKLLSANNILVMKARLYTTLGDFEKGLNHYDTLIKNHPNKHYAQEFAEVLISKKEIEKASQVISSNKNLYTDKELKVIEDIIKSASADVVGTEADYFKDIANNVRTSTYAWWNQGESSNYRFGLRLGVSSYTSAVDEKTDQNYAGLTIDEKWSMSLKGRTEISFSNISIKNKRDFYAITGKQLIQYTPTDRQMFGLFASSEILTYTASLTGKNIRNNSLGYMTHIMFDGKNGIYSQGSIGTISDNNIKYDFFGSAYHLFSTKPLIKAGINFSGLHYKHNRESTYFSPNIYLSTEVFADYSTSLFGYNNFILTAQAAYGIQKNDAVNWDNAFRLMIDLSYSYKFLEIGIKYQTSNIQSSTGTGYQFDWFTTKLSLRF